MEKLKLDKLLQGLEIIADAHQSIRGLSIVPLRVSDPDFELGNKYANPLDVVIKTTSYGRVTIPKAKNGETLIMPANMYYVTKKSQQDHAISQPQKVGSSDVRTITARCVESSQGGTGNFDLDKTDIGILPVALREISWNKQESTEMSDLWKPLGAFNNQMNSGGAQALKSYFNKWSKDLAKFIAHFERPDDMIGFITYFKGEIVAVDKFPSREYAKWMWEPLVRDAYGSLVLSDHIKNQTTDLSVILDEAKELKSNNLSPLELMVQSVTNAKDKIHAQYSDRLNDMMDIEFKRTSAEGSDVYSLEAEGYIGHTVKDQGFYAHMSIIKKESFSPEGWRLANESRKIARKQRPFGGMN